MPGPRGRGTDSGASAGAGGRGLPWYVLCVRCDGFRAPRLRSWRRLFLWRSALAYVTLLSVCARVVRGAGCGVRGAGCGVRGAGCGLWGVGCVRACVHACMRLCVHVHHNPSIMPDAEEFSAGPQAIKRMQEHLASSAGTPCPQGSAPDAPAAVAAALALQSLPVGRQKKSASQAAWQLVVCTQQDLEAQISANSSHPGAGLADMPSVPSPGHGKSEEDCNVYERAAPPRRGGEDQLSRLNQDSRDQDVAKVLLELSQSNSRKRPATDLPTTGPSSGGPAAQGAHPSLGHAAHSQAPDHDSKKHRPVYTPEQIRALTEGYLNGHIKPKSKHDKRFLTPSQREALATKTGLTLAQVDTWLHNRRKNR